MAPPTRTRGTREQGRAKGDDEVTAKALVLVYHRVAELRFDSQRSGSDPSGLPTNLEHARGAFRSLPLDVLADAVRAGAVPHRVLAFPFDDGYVDNLIHAFTASGRCPRRRSLTC